MKLKKCLEIIKTYGFTVFVYPKGHVKECRGIDEAYLVSFEVQRDEQGNIKQSEMLKKYGSLKVKEIIPSSNHVNIVVEKLF